MQVRSARPTSITALAVMVFVLASLSLFTGLAAMLFGFVAADYSALAATILLLFGPIVFVFGILEIAYGIGFLEGKRWSWTMGLVVAVTSLISSIAVIGLSLTWLSMTTSLVDDIAFAVIVYLPFIAIIPITTSSATILLLTRPRAKAFFGEHPRPEGTVP